MAFLVPLFRFAFEKHDEQNWHGGHNFFLHELQTGIVNSPFRIDVKNSSNRHQMLRIITVADVPAAARLCTRPVLHAFTCL